MQDLREDQGPDSRRSYIRPSAEYHPIRGPSGDRNRLDITPLAGVKRGNRRSGTCGKEPYKYTESADV